MLYLGTDRGSFDEDEEFNKSFENVRMHRGQGKQSKMRPPAACWRAHLAQGKTQTHTQATRVNEWFR